MLQVTSDNLLLELYLSGNFMAKPLKLFPLFYAYYKKILMLLWDKLAIAHALTLCMEIPNMCRIDFESIVLQMLLPKLIKKTYFNGIISN